MSRKLLISGIALILAGTVGILFAIVLEMQTGEPVYYLVMKLTAILFGIGGPILGLAIGRRRRK